LRGQEKVPKKKATLSLALWVPSHFDILRREQNSLRSDSCSLIPQNTGNARRRQKGFIPSIDVSDKYNIGVSGNGENQVF